MDACVFSFQIYKGLKKIRREHNFDINSVIYKCSGLSFYKPIFPRGGRRSFSKTPKEFMGGSYKSYQDFSNISFVKSCFETAQIFGWEQK